MEKDDRGKESGKSFLLFILALPFLAIGAFVLWLAISTVTESRRMQAWPTVPARIDETNLETHEHHDADGHSITYITTARYSYEYEGSSYTGSRVSHSAGTDNVDSFHQDVFKELSQLRDTGTPGKAYVNPSNPAESILYPHYRGRLLFFYLLFGSVFVGAGTLLMIAPFLGGKASTQSALNRGHSEVKPWESRKEWRSGVIHSSTKGPFIALLIFSVVWTGATSFAALPVFTGGGRLGVASFLGLIFPLVGLALFAFSIRLFLVWRKFGVSTLRLKNLPARPGASLEGDIEVKRPFESGTQVDLDLSCNKRHTTGSGKHRRTETKKLWSEKWRVSPTPLGGQRGARISVSCKIPEDAMESSESSQVTWDLTATANIPGVDYFAQFEVPVFSATSGGDLLLEDDETENE